MGKPTRKIDDDGVNLAVRLLPEFRARAYTEADIRARNYEGAVAGEKRSKGSYLGAVAVLHFLRLPSAERSAIYAEMRRFMDERAAMGEEDPFDLPPYSPPTEGPDPADVSIGGGLAVGQDVAPPPVHEGHGDPEKGDRPRGRGRRRKHVRP